MSSDAPAPANSSNFGAQSAPLDWREENRVRRLLEAHAASSRATRESISAIWRPFDSSPWDGQGQSRLDWLNGQPNRAHEWRESLLHSAARALNQEVLLFLLEKGADPLALNSNTEQPIDKLWGLDRQWLRLGPDDVDAALRCVGILVSALAPAEQAARIHGFVDTALRHRLVVAAAFLLENAPFFELGETGLSWAARAITETAKLEDGPRELALDKQIRFFRELARRFGPRAIDAPNEDGVTPLLASVRLCHARSAQALLDLGANPRARDAAGRNAQEIAQESLAQQKHHFFVKYGHAARGESELRQIVAAVEAKEIALALAESESALGESATPGSESNPAAIAKRNAPRL